MYVYLLSNIRLDHFAPPSGKFVLLMSKTLTDCRSLQQGLAEQSGMTGSYSEVDEFDVEQVETVSNK